MKKFEARNPNIEINMFFFAPWRLCVSVVFLPGNQVFKPFNSHFQVVAIKDPKEYPPAPL